MPTPPETAARVISHPGSSESEIAAEPNWAGGHQHRIGYINAAGRRAGLTHDGDHELEDQDERARVEAATKKYRDLRARAMKGDLINFVDVMKAQTVGPHGVLASTNGTSRLERRIYSQL